MKRVITLDGGVEMPLVGFGTWKVDGQQGYETTRRALAAGYRHIDTATMYGNEAEVGRALRDSGVRREDVFLATKLPAERVGRERETLDDSLRALGTEYVDLWLIHWPPDDQASPQTWREFLDARQAGWARAVGVSNYSAAQIDELIEATGQAPAVNQIPWSPARYDALLLAECRDRGVAVEGYSPFRHTDLADPVLVAIAAEHGVTPAQVVLRWHLERDIVVIPKSSTPDRIAANLDVFGFHLSTDEVARIDRISGQR